MNIVRKEDFDHICRFCFDVTTLNNIFQDNTLLTIIQEISIVTQISPNDALPKSLCQSCIKQVLQFYIFKKKTLESETKLQQILTNTELIKNNTFTREIEFEDCENFVNTVDTPDIDNSDDFLVTVNNEDGDSETSTSETDEEYFDVTSDSEDETFRKTYNIPKKVEIVFTDTETFQSGQYDNYLEIAAEERTNDSIPENVKQKPLTDPKIIYCICGLSFTDEFEYSDHRKDPKHIRWRPAFCDVCGRTFRNKPGLIIHMRTHTKERPFECELCLFKFSQRGSYLRHLKVHTRVRPYSCEICGLSFKESSTLDIHLKTHSTDKPYTCQFCNVDFTSKQCLNNHIKKNHLPCPKNSSKEYLCSLCGKICNDRQSFNNHSIRFHSNEKRFVCKICSKKFKTRANLTQHIRSHSDVRKYVCKICDKKFIQGSHLSRHLKTHTGEKKFQCRFCEKRFTVNYNLTVHERIHTGEKPYVCEVCSKAFYASNELKKHKRLHENNS